MGVDPGVFSKPPSSVVDSTLGEVHGFGKGCLGEVRIPILRRRIETRNLLGLSDTLISVYDDTGTAFQHSTVAAMLHAMSHKENSS